MRFLQAYKMAIKSIMSNKVRSFLTMLGVIIGVAAVITSVAFAQGTTKKTMDQFESLGANLIQVTIQGRNSNRNVSYEDLEKLQQENPNIIASIAPSAGGNATVKVGIKSRSTSLIGTTPEYEQIQSRHVTSGRFLTSFDVDYREKVALVGTAVVNDVFDGENPIGKDMKINGQIFKVIGVLEEISEGQDQSTDDQVIIPVSVAQRLTKSVTIRSFSVQATSTDTVDAAVTNVSDFLFKIYNDSKLYRVTNMAQILSTLGSITGILMVILGGIATISLVVGGIGIMNIMLVSVTERTREIGIRKAIGAKKRNILTQFLIEALVVTGLGGIIGVILGLLLIKFVISRFVPPVYSVTWISISFGISLLIGIIFGMFPANKAANLNPIDALSYE